MKAPAIALAIAASVAWSQNSPLVNRALSQQLAHVTTDERIRAYERLLAGSPDDSRIQTGLISAYLQKLREAGDFGYLDRASKLVDKVLEKDGGNFVALRLQNEIDLERHDFRGVAERAQDMAKYAPSDPGNWGNLGDALMELGEYERAGRAYLRMFALRPSLASYNRLAYFRFVTGDARSALDLMRNAVDAGDPQPQNVAWCWAELGDMYFKTGQLPEAALAYHAALELFPSLHRASAGLGKVEAAQGQIEPAIRNYERAQSIVPMVEYAAALEDLYTAAGITVKARAQRELIEAIEKLGKATNEKTNRNLALALADHKRDLDLALDLIQAEIPTRGDVYTWDALAWVLFNNGRLEEAKAATAKALRFATPEPVFYYHAGKIALASGDDKAAHEYSARLMSLNAKFDFAKMR
jgi:tetratricopeptide (TPR) repeat protein